MGESNSKSVLIVGGSGFLGYRLALALRHRHKVFATYFTRPMRIDGVSSVPLSLKNRTWTKRLLQAIAPEVVIYCAGNNSVEWAERSPKEANAIHTAGSATLGTLAEYFQPKFFFISNAYVFDGIHGNYHENDTVLPLTALGKAKLAGENFLKGRAMSYAVLRCSPVLDRSHPLNPSWLDRLRGSLARGERLALSTHEQHAYTDFASLQMAIEALLPLSFRSRVLNVAGITKLSPYEVGLSFAERFGFDSRLITRMDERSLKQLGPPVDYSLNSTEWIGLTGKRSPTIDEIWDRIAAPMPRVRSHIPSFDMTSANVEAGAAAKT